MPKKSHVGIFVIQDFVQNMKRHVCEFRLYHWDHVCNVNQLCLVDCFHCKFMVSTQNGM